MSNVDSSLAPEGATHYAIGSPDPWRDYSGIDALFFSTLRRTWDRMSLSSATCIRSELPKEERPQLKPWSGPEDGLPPINARIYMHLDESDEWILGTVIAHVTLEDGDAAVAHNGKDVFNGYASDFRAIWTPESRESERRETAIRELMDIAQVDCRVTAARLVDAGFKREVV